MRHHFGGFDTIPEWQPRAMTIATAVSRTQQWNITEGPKDCAFDNVQGKVISRHFVDENTVVLFYVERQERNAICRRATSMIRSIGATGLPKCAR